MSLISCKNLCLGYEGQKIINNINFDISDRDYLCIVGENGAGKSTLVKALLGLLKPMSGALTIDDTVKKNEIGYLPQQSGIQKDFPASVMEVVLSGRLNRISFRPFYSREDKKDAKEKLEMMGIGDLKNKCYNELSGGQKQRALLARAMCASKKILLLDEPVAALDPLATQEFYDLIKKINAEYGIAIIMVSHDIEAAVKYASHILHLSADTSFFGTADEYLCSREGQKFAGGIEQ